MSTDSAANSREKTSTRLYACSVWLFTFAALAMFVHSAVHKWCAWRSEETLHQSTRRLFTSQMDQLRLGATHCLCQPTADQLNEVLADSACAANVQEVYLAGDVSDERLSRFRELPNLTCIVVVMAENTDVLLRNLQGITTIQQLTIDHSLVSQAGLEVIHSFPRLQLLSITSAVRANADVQSIANHPTLETIILTPVDLKEDLIETLRSMPQLRRVIIGDNTSEATNHWEALRRALPQCDCTISSAQK